MSKVDISKININIIINIIIDNVIDIKVVIKVVIGDWGLGIGDWAQSPIPNPQSPIYAFLYCYRTILFLILLIIFSEYYN